MLLNLSASILGFLLIVSGNNTKYWIHSNNWSNPKNWDFAPNPCDAVILPDLGYEYSVLVSNNAKLHSLEFPSTGEIVFADRSSVSLSSLGPQCPSPIGNTYRTRQYSWGDPNNWYSEPPSPVFDTADSDKIPCLTDTVVFNESIVYNVLLDKNVEVGALHIGDESLSTEGVRTYAGGPGRGQLQFINLAELVVTGRTVCTNPEGCLCGNELDCSLVQCPRQHCVKPIRSKGICCHYCGAEVRFRPPAGFYLMKFKESLAHFLTKQTRQLDDKIAITVSLQEYELRLNIQITVSDSITDGSYEGAGYESSKIAQRIHEYIVEYDIVRDSDLIIEQSHQPYNSVPQEAKDLSTSYSAGIESWVLYLVLGVSIVLLLVIVFLLFKCSRRYRGDNNIPQSHVRLDHGSLPRTLDSRFKPCVPALDQDIPTYEEVLMEDMLTRGIAPDQPRNHDNTLRGNHDNTLRGNHNNTLRGNHDNRHNSLRTNNSRRAGYNEVPSTDISDQSRV